MISFKMTNQKKISDYVTVLKPVFEVASGAIIIDSNDEIDEEEDFIEDSETLQTISDCQPASSHKNEHKNELHIDNMSEHAINQSNCRSDEECVNNNVDEDMTVL